MPSRRRVQLAASFVMTVAGVSACDRAPAPVSNPPGPSQPQPVTPEPLAASAPSSAGGSAADTVVAPVAPVADAGDDGGPPFRRHGPILNPPRPRPAPGGN